MRLQIQKWHYGKMIILWAWVSVIVEMLLVLARDKDSGSIPVVLERFAAFVFVLALSVVTWIWLGGKEQA